MASLEKRSPTDAVDDAITPDPRDPAHAPATPEQLLDGRRSSSTSGREITEKGSGDVEKNSVGVGSVRGDPEPETEKRSALSQAWKRHRRWITHLTIFLVFTAWWIFGLVFHRSDEKGWLIPTLLYIAILLRLFFYYVPSSLAMRPIRWTWGKTAVPVYDAIPSKMHQPLAAIIAVAVILIGAFVPEETGDNTRANRAVSVFGLIVLLAVLTLTSKDRSAIPWHTVIGGMLTQFIVAVFVLRTQAGFDIFKFISDRARELLGFAGAGMSFLTSPDVLTTGWFLVNVIPAIVFFIALVAMLFHIGFLQWFIGKFATFFFWSLRVSGAEAIVAAATPFIGQGESAMLIRPYVNHLTMSELHQIMVCGFATIAGSVLVFYIGLGLNAQALVSSCIMSIPATLAVSKMRYPEKETPMTAGKLKVPEEEEEKHVNALHAFTDGSWIGLRIAGTIVACVMTVVALVALVNGLLTWWGGYWNISNPNLTLELIMGYLLYPVAWLLGVPGPDVRRVAELIGIKIIVNEFAAFKALTEDAYYMSMAARSRVIATYACCGFGNIGSLGIQIGILSQIAPKRSGDVVRVAVSAFITGVLSTLTSASVAGMLYNESMS